MTAIFAYNETTRTGHMLLWDVGMTSMVAMEIRVLADLALTASARRARCTRRAVIAAGGALGGAKPLERRSGHFREQVQ